MDMKVKEWTEHRAVHRRLLREHEDVGKQHDQLLEEHNAIVVVAEEE